MDSEDAKQGSKKRPLNLQEPVAGESEPASAKRADIGAEDEDAKKPAEVPKPQKVGKAKGSRRKSGASDSKKRSADQLNFPEKLMQLVNDNVAPRHVSWIDNEEAIAFKADGFQQHVLDQFFQGLKYDSFVRKLNRWGFRRVTSEGVPRGTVAYYHNSFRKEEQDLLRTMGIGKKNDPAPEPRDLQAFGGEHSLIGSAGAAIAAGASLGGGDVSLSAAGAAAHHLDSHFLTTANRLNQQQPTGLGNQISGVSTALRSEATLPPSTRQESKAEFAGTSLNAQLMDTQQLLLEAMLARQRQTDVAALQEREAAMLAESILLQQTQQQQRANAAISSALASTRDDDLTLKLAALAAQSASMTGQPQQPRAFRPQLPQPELDPRLSSDPALELLIRQRLQSTNAGAGLGLRPGATIPPNLNSLGNVAANVNIRGSLTPNIQGNLNQLANAAVNANTQGNVDLETVWRALLQSRQRDRTNPGPAPGQGPADQGPPR